MPTLLILGGYGAVGFHLANHLRQETNIDLVIAGRSELKAANVAAQMSGLFAGSDQHVNSMRVDAADPDSLHQAFAKVDAVIVAAPVMENFSNIVEAAIAAKIDCLDLIPAPDKYTLLQEKASQITEAGCCFVTDAGVYPGLPAVLARHALAQQSDIDTIQLATLIRPDWESFAMSDELAREQLLASSDVKAGVIKAGNSRRRWRIGSAARRIDFGEPFGVHSCAPVLLQELAEVPDFAALREVGLWEGGVNGLAELLILPLARLQRRLQSSATLRLWVNGLRASLRTSATPPFGALLKVTAYQRKNAIFELSLFHEDVQAFAGIAATAGVLQYLDEDWRKPGVWFQGRAMEPSRFIEDLTRLGIQSTTNSPDA